MGDQELNVFLQAQVQHAHGGGMRLAHITVEVQLRGNAGLVALILPALGEIGRGEAEDNAKPPAVLRQPCALLGFGLELQIVERGVIALVHVHAEGHAGVVVAVAGIVDVLLGFLDEGVAGIAGGELLHFRIEKFFLLRDRAVTLHHDVVFQSCLILGGGEGFTQRVVRRLKYPYAVVLHLNLEVAGCADAHQTLLGKIRGEGMPGIDQQKPAIDQRRTVQRNGAGVFQAGVAFILDAPEGIVQRFFPGWQIRRGHHPCVGCKRGALLGAQLVHHGVELQFGFGVFVFNAVAGGNVIVRDRQRAQIKHADAHHHHNRQNAGGAKQRLVGVALHFVDLFVGVDSHTAIPPFRA